MSQTEIYLNKTGKSNKYWKYKIGPDHVVQINWGRIGTNGSKKKYEFESRLAADNFVYKKIEEKYRKGYSKIDNDQYKLEVLRAKIVGSNFKIQSIDLVKYDPDTKYTYKINNQEAANPNYVPIAQCIFKSPKQLEDFCFYEAFYFYEDKIMYSGKIESLFDERPAHSSKRICWKPQKLVDIKLANPEIRELADRIAPAIETLQL